jgi:hypothetical protein
MRHVLYCGNTVSGVMHDHAMLTVGILENGVWSWSTPRIAFGPELATTAQTQWFDYHTCDPDAVRGAFDWNGHVYSWAVFFTGYGCTVSTPLDEQGACDSQSWIPNQVGVAFADSLDAPESEWQVFPEPLVSGTMEFGQPCVDGDFCVGQPSVTSVDGAGKVLVFYAATTHTGGAFSSRLIDLSDATSPVYLDWVHLSSNGLPCSCGTGGNSPCTLNNVAFAYDPGEDRFVISADTGPFNGGKLQPDTTLAWMAGADVRSGSLTASWNVLHTFGSCFTGFPYNNNSGIVRTGLGVLPDPSAIDVVFTSSPGNTLADLFGVWSYRLWEADLLSGAPPADPKCP